MKLKLIYEDVAATSFGKELKKLFSKNEAFTILDSEAESAGGTYTQGGCYVLAKVLVELIPQAELWGVYRDGGEGILPAGYADHFMVKVGDNFYDSDGASSAGLFMKRWSEELTNPTLKKAMTGDVHPETAHGRSLIKKVRDYIKAEISQNPNFRQAYQNLVK